MRWFVMAAVLVACGGKGDDDGAGGPFDLDDYCEATADCYNDFWAAYQADTGVAFVYDAETCVLQWEAQQAQYADGPCEQTHKALEDCIANAEHLVCVRGSYASGACTVEALDVTECLQELYQ